MAPVSPGPRVEPRGFFFCQRCIPRIIDHKSGCSLGAGLQHPGHRHSRGAQRCWGERRVVRHGGCLRFWCFWALALMRKALEAPFLIADGGSAANAASSVPSACDSLESPRCCLDAARPAIDPTRHGPQSATLLSEKATSALAGCWTGHFRSAPAAPAGCSGIAASDALLGPELYSHRMRTVSRKHRR